MPVQAYRSYYGQILTRVHGTAQMNLCRRHLKFRLAYHKNKSRFNLSHTAVLGFTVEEGGFANACVLQRNCFGGSSVIVQVGIWGGGEGLMTRLIVVNGKLNAQGYVNQILMSEAVPFIQRQAQQVTLQQDNARPHTTRLSQQFLQAVEAM